MIKYQMVVTTDLVIAAQSQGLKTTLSIVMTSLLLAACSGTARIDAPVNPEWEQRRQVLESISSWEFTGSINVRDTNDSHSSRIRWR